MPYNKHQATVNTLKPITDWIKREYKLYDLLEDETLPVELRNSYIDRIRQLDSLIKLIKKEYGIETLED